MPLFSRRLVLPAMAACAIGVSGAGPVQAQAGCSPQEQQLLVAYFQRTMEAMMYGDIQTAERLAQQADSAVSPGCAAALAQSQRQPSGPRYAAPQPPGRILDHGGGMYSAPGIGFCGPSGCIAY